MFQRSVLRRKLSIYEGGVEDPFDVYDLDDVYSLALSEGIAEEVVALGEGMTPYEFREYLIRLLAHAA
ncbi:MAG TPA: hypothetical protein VGQ83_22385 [Polyangia bacterium]|jgi:hypothetical protein